MDVQAKVTGDFMIECIGCSLIMELQYLDTEESSALNIENIMNSHLATNLIYHTSKIIPSVASLQGDDATPSRNVCKTRNERKLVNSDKQLLQ